MELPDQPDVLDTQLEIKVEKDTDDFGSRVDIQRVAGHEDLETYQAMNVCIDGTEFDWIAGQASVSHKTHSKCQASLDTKEKTLNAKAKCFRCDICNKSFSTLGLVKEHMLIHGGKSHSCETCGKSFTLPSNLKRHQRIHTGKTPFECKICGRRFCFPSRLSAHMQCHTAHKPYKCWVCEKRFRRSNYLSTHMRFHTGEKPYKCEICEKLFTQSSQFSDHMKIHTGEKPYECGSCGMSFTRLDNLKRHLRTHTGIKPLTCGKCEQSFTFAGMQYHKLHVHKETKPDTNNLKGQLCNRTISSKIETKEILKSKRFDKATVFIGPPSSLKQDIAEIRTGSSEQVPYEYKSVGYSLEENSSLKQHYFTGVKSHSCDTCGISFTYGSSLKYHMQYVHDAESVKLNECKICKKRFSKRSTLLAHFRTHSRDNPYKCGSCSMSFTRLRSLKKHLRTHSGPNKWLNYFRSLNRAEIHNHKLHSQKETKTYTEVPKDKQGDRAVDSTIKPKEIIQRPKQFDNKIISINQNSSLKQEIAETCTHSTEQTDQIKKQNVSLSRIIETNNIIRPNTMRHKSSSEETENVTDDFNLEVDRDITSDIESKGIINRWNGSIDQNLTMQHDTDKSRIVSIDETKKQNHSVSRILPSPKIKGHKSSEETRYETKDPKFKLFDRATSNKIKFKGIIHMSKQFDYASISMEQSSKFKNDHAETSKKSTDQVDATKNSNTPCLLKGIEKTKDLSSGDNYATKFCNLDLRRRIANSARKSRNNNV